MPPETLGSNLAPLAWVAFGIVGVGAVWFTSWVVERLEKDRTRLHGLANLIQKLEWRLETVEKDVERLTKAATGTIQTRER